MLFLDFFVFTLVLLLLIGAGVYRSRRVNTESQYLFAERSTPFLPLTATLVMTEFNSATLISFSSLGYIAGYWALIMPFIFLIGLLFYALTVAKKWKEYDGSSVAGFFTERYSRKIGSMASLLLLLAMTGFSAAYIKSLILIFQPIFPSLNPWILSGSLLGLIFLMSLRGGLIAIIRTDMLSLVLMLIFFPIMVYSMWKAPNLEAMPISISDGQTILPFSFVFSLIILTMFTYILAPWYGQKIFAAKSPKVALSSVVVAAILVFLLYGLSIFATALLRKKGYICPTHEQALPFLIDRCLIVGMKGFAYALLFATSATTLTGVWSAMSSMWIGDFLKKKVDGYSRSMLVTTIFAFISYALANTLVDRVFDKMILANIPVAALSFGLLAGFYWKRASLEGAYLSILTGCIVGVGAYFYFGEAGGYTWYWTVYGIPLIFLSGIFGSLMQSTSESQPIRMQ